MMEFLQRKISFSIKTEKISGKLKIHTEAVVQRCSIKKVFLEILQNSQENTCATVSFLMSHLCQRIWHWCFLVNYVKFLRIPFFHRTRLVAASVISSKWTT